MVKKIVCVLPFSHTWFWLGTSVSSLVRNPPVADGCEVEVIVVNASPWSPAIRAVTDTRLGEYVTVMDNFKSNKFHASSLDCVVERMEFDYLMSLETDVLALRPTWLQWFVDQLRDTDYAVGHWHHEEFLNPSCTLYRGNVLRDMLTWCKTEAPQDELRWGPEFSQAMPLDNNLPLTENPPQALQNIKGWICGPFAEKRGWPAGTRLKSQPSGQLKSGGWYEPGQQLHHWAVERGYTYTVCETLTTTVNNVPVQTMYGPRMVTDALTNEPIRNGVYLPQPDPQRQLEAVELFGNAETAHLWGGTRALDILKHEVTCGFVKANTPTWLAREARFWKSIVPPDVQAQTLELIRKYGWHITGQGSDHVSDRDREAAAFVQACYEEGGVTW